MTTRAPVAGANNALALSCFVAAFSSCKVHCEAFTASPHNTPNIHSRYLYCQIIIFRAERSPRLFSDEHLKGITAQAPIFPPQSFGKDQINSEGMDRTVVRNSSICLRNVEQMWKSALKKQSCNAFHTNCYPLYFERVLEDCWSLIIHQWEICSTSPLN